MTAAHHYTVAIDSGALSRQNRAIAYNNRGVAWARLGDYERALADFTEARALTPGDSILFSNIQAAEQQVAGNMATASFAERKRAGGLWFL